MEQTASTSRYILTGLAVVLVITAFILVGLNAYEQQQQRAAAPLAANAGNPNQEYIDGYTAARAKYQAMYPAGAIDTLSVRGQIQKISGSSITIMQQSLDTDPKVDGVSDQRTITLSADTVIMTYTAKTPEEIMQDRAANPNQPPSTSTAHTLKVSDLKVGQTILVQSSSDVRLAATIAATQVTLLQ